MFELRLKASPQISVLTFVSYRSPARLSASDSASLPQISELPCDRPLAEEPVTEEAPRPAPQLQKTPEALSPPPESARSSLTTRAPPPPPSPSAAAAGEVKLGGVGGLGGGGDGSGAPAVSVHCGLLPLLVLAAAGLGR